MLDTPHPSDDANEGLNAARAEPYILPPFSRPRSSGETARDEEVRELRASNAALAERLAQMAEMMMSRPGPFSDTTGQTNSHRSEHEDMPVSNGRDEEIQTLREANKALTKRLERVENQLEAPPSYVVNA